MQDVTQVYFLLGIATHLPMSLSLLRPQFLKRDGVRSGWGVYFHFWRPCSLCDDVMSFAAFMCLWSPLFCHSLMWTETMFFFIRGWVMPLCTCIKRSVKLNFYSFSHSRVFVSLSRWSNCISPGVCVPQKRCGCAF